MKFCAYKNWKCKNNPKSIGPISPTVLGAVGPEQYQFLYCIDSHPTAAALCWADWPNTPPHPVVLCWADRPNTAPTPLLSGGDTAPPPLPWQGGRLSLWQFRHTCWANCSTCSRLTLPKTAVRDGFKGLPIDWYHFQPLLTHIVPNGRFRPCIFTNF